MRDVPISGRRKRRAGQGATEKDQAARESLRRDEADDLVGAVEDEVEVAVADASGKLAVIWVREGG